MTAAHQSDVKNLALTSWNHESSRLFGMVAAKAVRAITVNFHSTMLQKSDTDMNAVVLSKSIPNQSYLRSN
jgi:hypothetical protein